MTTLITNANIFDGKSEKIAAGMSVLIEGDKISKIAKSIAAPKGATSIDAGGKFLMPGFVGCHEHLMMQMSLGSILTNDTRYVACLATQTTTAYLMQGWTSVRDTAGNTFALKKSIDEGHCLGPRIFPCGAMISQTSGHGDMRFDAHPSCFCEIGKNHEHFVAMGDMCVVDGPADVLKAVREQLRLGATQIKLAAGGGTGSRSDPLEVVEFTLEEMKAAVAAADDFNTYVCTHVYNDKGIRRAIEAGVKCIEHGNLMSEETMLLMKEKDLWLSPQVTVYTYIPSGYTPEQEKKHRQAFAGIDNMFTIAKKIGFDKIVCGSDIICDPERIKTLNNEFVERLKWFTPFEILRQATSNGGELIGMSKRFNPGTFGVIQEGALADILLVNGNPLDDIKVLTKPKENLALIMKGGKIFKNIL